MKLKSSIDEEKRQWLEEKELEISRMKSEYDLKMDEMKRNRSSEALLKANIGIVEKHQLSVKQLESQISAVESQLQIALKTRDDLAQAVFKLSNENEEMKKQVETVEQLEKEKLELESRYVSDLTHG